MLICCAIAVSTANAQTENYFGPKKGDFAITIGAEPVINFVFGDRFAVTAGIGIKNSKSTSFSHHPEDEDYKEIILKSSEGDRHFSLDLGTQYYPPRQTRTTFYWGQYLLW